MNAFNGEYFKLTQNVKISQTQLFRFNFLLNLDAKYFYHLFKEKKDAS